MKNKISHILKNRKSKKSSKVGVEVGVFFYKQSVNKQLVLEKDLLAIFSAALRNLVKFPKCFS